MEGVSKSHSMWRLWRLWGFGIWKIYRVLHLHLPGGCYLLHLMQIGAIFDWDGVVIDSSQAHEASWERLAKEEQLPLFEGHFKQGFGRKNEFIIPHILQWTQPADHAATQRLGERKEFHYREILRECGIEPLPGVRDLLEALRSQGISCAVGSSTSRLNLETVIGLLQFEPFFQAIVSAEDVEHGKPQPDVFLTAAERLQRAPQHCIVFEDAHVGIEAGLAGGMKVVAVATTHPLATLQQAHCAVERLTDVSVDKLIDLCKQ